MAMRAMNLRRGLTTPPLEVSFLTAKFRLPTNVGYYIMLLCYLTILGQPYVSAATKRQPQFWVGIAILKSLNSSRSDVWQSLYQTFSRLSRKKRKRENSNFFII